MGNFFAIPLFFGVDFIFGSIAALIAIFLFGRKLGVLAAVLIGSYTVWRWNHPYALAALAGEALFVAITLPRFRSNLALSSGTYWIFLGIPQVFIFYRYSLEMESAGAMLAALKQGVNGIVNAIVASLLVTYTPLYRLTQGRVNFQISVFQNIFNIFVATALLPAMVVVIVDARSAVNDVENIARSRLDTIGTAIALNTERWAAQHTKSIEYLARIVTERGPGRPAELQSFIDNHQATWPIFHGSFVTDARGITMAFNPAVNPRGEKTLGHSFADRLYFTVLRDGQRGPYISDVFMARGGVFEPVFNLVAPYFVNGRFGGIVSGSVNLGALRDTLLSLPSKEEYHATLVDRAGTVVASNNPALTPLAKYELGYSGEVTPWDANHYQRWPDKKLGYSPMTRWRESSLGREISLPDLQGWKLAVEFPLGSVQALLFQRYIRDMAFLLGLAMLILVGSALVASRIARPLSQLSAETTNLPRRLQLHESIRWPKSRLFEVGVLVENFHATVESLKRRFEDLETSRVQLAKAKEEAENANRLKSAFLANMSHEIRTPLGVIMGFSDLLLDESASIEERKQHALKIKRNGEQLAVLVNDILDLSKVEAGYLTLEIVRFNLRVLLDEVISDLQEKAQGKGLRLTLQIADGVSDFVATDPVRLKQILWNLLGNAIKFTHKGEVSLVVVECGEQLEIEVRDSGIGIEPGDQQKLFRPFTQADESMTRKYGGTGLGLALSKRLSHLLGGDLHLKESRVGQGSVFHFSVKNQLNSAGEGKSQATAEAQNTKPVASPNHGIKGLSVLLVEDSEDNQYLIGQILSRQGARVEMAANGQEGVAKALKGHHDLVIMDLQMPVLDGYAATHQLRGQGYNKPIIALTAHAMSEVKDRCLAAGCTDHLPKPVDPKVLLATLSRYARDLG